MIHRNTENFPVWVHRDLDDLDLDPFTLRVYLHLARRANGTGKAWPSREAIATHCRMSEKQVTRCIQRLEEEGLIVVVRTTQTDGGRRNTYWLTSTDEWLQKAVAKSKKEAGVWTVSPNVQGGVGTEERGGGDSQSFRHTVEGKPIEGKPIESAQAPAASSPLSANAVFDSYMGGQKAKRAGSKKKTPPPDPRVFLCHAPREFAQDDDFVHAWSEWGQNRIEAKNPLTERGAKIALGKLTKHPLKIAIEALERSTMNSWTGVFPESIAPNGKSGKFGEASSQQPPQDFKW